MLSLAAFALFAASALQVQAETHAVDVGATGLTFTPSSVTAVSGDTIVFTFRSGSHTVTESSFASPCTPLNGGDDSGPMPVAGTTTPPTYTYNVTDASSSWFYCKTGTHCKSGMVFAVNPTDTETFEAFQAAATGGASSSGVASSGSPSSGTGAATPTSSRASSTSRAVSSVSGAATSTPSGGARGHASIGAGAVAAAAALLFGGMAAV